MVESTSGRIRVTLDYEGRKLDWAISSTYEIVESVKMPIWVEQRLYGGSGPDSFIRIEMREGSPQVVGLSWTSQPHQGEIKQKHLRSIELDKMATDLLAATIIARNSHPEESFDEGGSRERIATKFVERQRMPREYRLITDEFLQSVAQVYRKNLGHAPTQAVAKKFGVRNRMASTYVDRARKAGYLSPTKQGQKKA